MPIKIDRSADMDYTTFNALFLKYHPLVCRVAISFQRSCSLSESPLFPTLEDMVSFACLEMRRLGIFSQYDASRSRVEDPEAAMLTYVGEQVRGIFRHAWQDHCRLNNRFKVKPSEISSDDDSKVTDAIDSKGSWDPNFDWDLAALPASDLAEEGSILDLLETEAELDDKHDASMIIKAMRRLPDLAAAPSIAAVSAALSLEPSRARKALESLRSLATSLGLCY